MWGASLCSLGHPWPHAGWYPLQSGCPASAPGRVAGGCSEAWGWSDPSVLSAWSETKDSLWWLQPGFIATLLLPGASCQVGPPRPSAALLRPAGAAECSVLCECHGQLERARSASAEAPTGPTCTTSQPSPTITNRSGCSTSLAQLSLLGLQPRGGGQKLGLSLPASPPPPIAVHWCFSHSSFSFLFLLCTKPQDQVTRSGFAHVNKTTKTFKKSFYFSTKLVFTVWKKKSYFGFQKANSESFSSHSCHKKFQYTSLHPPQPQPSLQAPNRKAH